MPTKKALKQAKTLKKAKAEAKAEAKIKAEAEAKVEAKAEAKAQAEARIEFNAKTIEQRTQEFKIDMRGKTIIFLQTVNMVKPSHEDKKGRIFIYASMAMSFFYKEKRIANIFTMKDFVSEMEKFEDDRFAWITIAFTFLKFYFKENTFNFLFHSYDDQLIKLAVDFVRENITYDPDDLYTCQNKHIKF